jgi:uncharacterized membrane protein
MLDKWFLNKLSTTGKIMYYVSQIIFVLVWLFVFVNILALKLTTQWWLFFLGVLFIILFCGVFCIKIWPKEKEEPIE